MSEYRSGDNKKENVIYVDFVKGKRISEGQMFRKQFFKSADELKPAIEMASQQSDELMKAIRGLYNEDVVSEDEMVRILDHYKKQCRQLTTEKLLEEIDLSYNQNLKDLRNKIICGRIFALCLEFLRRLELARTSK